MIYFDNAATSWPKPEEVYQEVSAFLRRAGANPGRGGHRLAREAATMVEETRRALAEFLGVKNSSQLIFTSNATEALNLGIKGVLVPGDHVVTTSMEHNSVLRPLHYLQREGISYTIVEANPEGYICPEKMEKAMQPNTKLVIMTHASNVTGTIMPIVEVGQWAQEHGLLLLVDGAQTVGELAMDLSKLPVDLLAFPGHKALLGPTGTGALFIREGLTLEPLLVGGTGVKSELAGQPEEMPYRYESGTLNTTGLAGLRAALSCHQNMGQSAISATISALTNRFIQGCSAIPRVTVYGPKGKTAKRTGVVSLNIQGLNPDELGFILDEVYGIAVRAGLHCAPQAHKTIGTYPAGTVRFSFSVFNNAEQVDTALEALQEIAGQSGG